MKASLKKLIEHSILIEYNLTCTTRGIDKSCVTHTILNDDCYKTIDNENFCRVIYESILYYSYDDFQLEGGDHQKMFLKAFNSKFKYNYTARDLAKRKLGIYGESLLYCMLRHFYHTDVLISRGLFYDIQKKSEVTGYDAFHLIQAKDELALWFGETKFYEDYRGAIDSIFKNIKKAISDDYLVNTNFVTILQHRGDIVNKDSKIFKLLDRWEKAHIDSLEKELVDNNIRLVYPVLIACDKVDNDYDKTIRSIIEYIKAKYSGIKFPSISIDYAIFFILIPIDDVKTSKEKIIKWIDAKEPLMS